MSIPLYRYFMSAFKPTEAVARPVDSNLQRLSNTSFDIGFTLGFMEALLILKQRGINIPPELVSVEKIQEIARERRPKT